MGAYWGVGSLPNYSLSKVLKCDTEKRQKRQDVFTAKLVAENLKKLCQLCLGDEV